MESSVEYLEVIVDRIGKIILLIKKLILEYIVKRLNSKN